MDGLLTMTKADLIEETSEPRTFGDPPPEVGKILDEDRTAAAGAVVLLRESQEDYRSRYLAQWRVNELRRKGYRSVKLRVNNNGIYECYIPPTATPDRLPHSNKAATLCRRTVSMLFADPPAPSCVPYSGDESDVEAAITSERVLEDIQSPSQLDTIGKLRRAFDRASHTASGYIFYDVNPYAGGRVPVVVEANPMAQTFEDATIDPRTGGPWAGEYEERYVTEDGRLTDDEAEAATRWAPGLRSEIVTGRNVCLIPHTADRVEEADGLILTRFVAWGTLLKQFPELKDLPQEERDQLHAYEPHEVDDLLIGFDRDHRRNTKNPNETLVCVDTAYFTECPEYPKGAKVIVIGGKYIPEEGGQEEWGKEVGGKWETFLLPLAQVKQFAEGDEGGPGHAMMEIVGPGDELRAAIWASYLDYIDRKNARKGFIPTNSLLHPKDLLSRRRRFLPINPGGQPFWEEIEDYGEENMEVYDRAGADQDDASGIQQIARGLEDSSVQSGRHAYAILGQVHAGLSELKQNVEKAYIRACMIELQLVRGFYDTPRLLKWESEDAEFRVKTWMGSDLKSSRDVKVRGGTMTMLTPEAKADLAEKWGQLQLIPPHKLREIVFKELGATVGVQDDPHLLRVKRQISKWNDGPPKIPQEIMAQYEMAMAQYQQLAAGARQDPATGQLLHAVSLDPLPPAPEHPFMPYLAEIFDQRLVDMTPDAAGIRFLELGNLMASKKYSKHDPQWRVGVDMEFQRMQMALTPPAPVVSAGEEGGGEGAQEQPAAAA